MNTFLKFIIYYNLAPVVYRCGPEIFTKEFLHDVSEQIYSNVIPKWFNTDVINNWPT